MHVQALLQSGRYADVRASLHLEREKPPAVNDLLPRAKLIFLAQWIFNYLHNVNQWKQEKVSPTRTPGIIQMEQGFKPVSSALEWCLDEQVGYSNGVDRD